MTEANIFDFEDDPIPTAAERPPTWPLGGDYAYHDWHPGYGIDREVVYQFTCGGCEAIALAIHRRTGWPIRVEWDEHGWMAHTWVVNLGGRAVDIEGVHAGPCPASTKPGRQITASSRADLEAECENSEYVGWAEQIVEAFPVFFGIAPTPTRAPRRGPAV